MKRLSSQLFPILLAALVCIILCIILFAAVFTLNLFPFKEKILLQFTFVDILVGITIYLKTSVDFALFIGRLMSKNPGTKSRIAIEIGTAIGNGLGTLFVLCIWVFFKEVKLLMAIMIFIASLVLLAMAEEGIEELSIHYLPLIILKNVLHAINSFFHPILKWIIPTSNIDGSQRKTFLAFFLFSLTIPLLLGLDDFAGYIPLFSVVNVVGFSLGVFIGHMLLTMSLFAHPSLTIRIVQQKIVVLLGSIAFVGIAIFGWIEIIKLFR